MRGSAVRAGVAGVAVPEENGDDDQRHDNGRNSPWNAASGTSGFAFELGSRRSSCNFLGEWFLCRNRRTGRFGRHRRRRGGGGRSRRSGRGERRHRYRLREFCDGGTWQRRMFRLPARALRVNLGLPQRSKILVDGFFVVQAEMFGISANESLIKNAAGKLIEMLVLDGLEHARADFGDVGNVIQGEFTALSLFTEFIAERSHGRSLSLFGFRRSVPGKWPTTGRLQGSQIKWKPLSNIIIGQREPPRHQIGGPKVTGSDGWSVSLLNG